VRRWWIRSGEVSRSRFFLLPRPYRSARTVAWMSQFAA